MNIFPKNNRGQSETYSPDTLSRRLLSLPNHQNAFLYTTLLLTVIALLLRIYRLGYFELWLDEAYTYRQTIVTDWLGSLLRDNSPPLYNLLMRTWSGLFGSSEFALRLPSAICGTLFIPAACYAGREIFDARTGLYCGLVATLSPIHLYYSQEARNYSLLTLLLLLSIHFLVRAARDDRPRDWRLAALCALLALYTHYLASLALLPLVAIVLVWSPESERRQRFRTFGLYTVYVLSLFLPWGVWSFLLNEHSLSGFDWMTPIWKNLPPALALPRTVEAFTFLTGPHILMNGTEFGEPIVLLPTQLTIPLRIVLVMASLSLLSPLGEARIFMADLPRRKWTVMALFVTPLLLLWGVSFFRPLYIVSRYDMVAYPAFVLLSGLLFTKLEAVLLRRLFVAFLLCWLILSALAISKTHSLPADTYKQESAQFLSRNVLAGDVVVFTGNRSYTTRYYLERAGVECRGWRCTWPDGTSAPYRKYPTANEDEEAVYDDDEVMQDSGQVSREIDEFLTMRRDAGSILWIVLKGKVMEDKSLLLRYLPDAMFLEELERRKLPCRLVAPELTIFACGERIEAEAGRDRRP